MSILAESISQLPHLQELMGTEGTTSETLLVDRERMPALTRVLIIVDEAGNGVKIWVIGKVEKGGVLTSSNPVNIVLACQWTQGKWESKVKGLFEMFKADNILGMTPQIKMALFLHNLVSNP
jgi:hypothetical protein